MLLASIIILVLDDMSVHSGDVDSFPVHGGLENWILWINVPSLTSFPPPFARCAP